MPAPNRTTKARKSHSPQKIERPADDNRLEDFFGDETQMSEEDSLDVVQDSQPPRQAPPAAKRQPPPPPPPAPAKTSMLPPGSSQDSETGDEASPDATIYGVKAKRTITRVVLRPEDELAVMEWLRVHTFMYDKQAREFKYSDRKWRLFEKKAKTLTPPIKGAQLRSWCDNIRSRFGKLTARKSGAGAEVRHSDRDQWILEQGSFFRGHIVRNKPRSTGDLPQPATSDATDDAPDLDDPVLAGRTEDEDPASGASRHSTTTGTKRQKTSTNSAS